MRRLGALAIAACAGCFIKPDPPGFGSASDAPMSDGTLTCAHAGPWSPAPIPITGGFHNSLPETSPWLSADGNELWFGRTYSPSDHDLVRTVKVSGVWGNSEPVPSLTTLDFEDDPFMTEDEMTLFYDAGPAGATQIYEATRHTRDVAFDPPTPHPELGVGALEPSLTRDGRTIYYAQSRAGVLTILRATRAGTTGSFSNVQPLAGGSAAIESPSIASDGTTLFFSDHSSGLQISSGQVSGSSIVGALRLVPFQMDGIQYFDPYISHDGTMLVFASTLAGSPTLNYVTRTCMP